MRQITRRARLAWISGIFFVLLGLLALPQLAAQSDPFGQPSPTDRQAAMIVAELIQRDHLSNRPLDEEISRRAFDAYLRALDPQKMYFTRSDVEQFSAHRDRLTEYLETGSYTFAFDVFNRFLERVDERVKLAEELVAKEHDFIVDEEMVIDRDLLEYVASEEEARERWRQRIKYSLLLMRNEEDATEDPQVRLNRRYRAFANRMRGSSNDNVIERFISAVTTSYDPHTTYMSKSSYENMMIHLRLELEGIGATLQSSDDGLTVIREIVPGGAADKSGELLVEDKIAGVAQGDDGEMVDTTDMNLDEVVQMIRGPAGTVVRLNTLRTGTGMRTIRLVRERVELRDREAKGEVFEVGQQPDGNPFKIGVIDLPSFYADMEGASRRLPDAKSTTRDVRRILEEFTRQNVDALVLDLRRNGGGALREAIDLTGLFIDRGPVVQVKDAYGQVQPLYNDNREMVWDRPLVVLTSKFSASASEILAGAIQDYGRGIVVGDTSTHGKGTVQSLLDLNRLLFPRIQNPPNRFGALKITMQQFYRPNGDSTQKRGVLADVVLPSITDHMDVGEADLEYALEFTRVPAATFRRMNLVNTDILGELATRSQQRIAGCQEFATYIRNIERYIEQKERKTVTLNEQQFLALRREFDADKEDERTIERQLRSRNDIERDFYLDEILSVAADYVKLMRDGKLAAR